MDLVRLARFPMIFMGVARRCGAQVLATVRMALLTLVMSISTAIAQTGPISSAPVFSTIAQARLTEPERMAELLTEHGGLRVIVEFAAAELPLGLANSGAAAVLQITDHIIASQDWILARTLPAADLDQALGRILALSLTRYSPMLAMNAG